MMDKFLKGECNASFQYIKEGLIIFCLGHSFSPSSGITQIALNEVYIPRTVFLIYKDYIEKASNFTLRYHYDEENPVVSSVCMNPRPEVIDYVRKHQTEIKSYAEIGVKFGATAEAVTALLSSDAIIDLYEKKLKFAHYLISAIPRANVMQGDARYTLLKNNRKYDLVYFDASHQYEIDKPVLDALVPHLTSDSTIIFDDYSSITDVQKLVDEFKSQKICKVITI